MYNKRLPIISLLKYVMFAFQVFTLGLSKVLFYLCIRLEAFVQRKTGLPNPNCLAGTHLTSLSSNCNKIAPHAFTGGILFLFLFMYSQHLFLKVGTVILASVSLELRILKPVV